MKVKLHSSLDKAGLGFIDPEGQKIRAKNPGKGEAIEVKATAFVQEKIATGELIVVDEKSSTPELGEKERKALFKTAKTSFDEARKLLNSIDISADLRMACDEVLQAKEKAIKEESVELLQASEQKWHELLKTVEEAVNK